MFWDLECWCPITSIDLRSNYKTGTIYIIHVLIIPPFLPHPSEFPLIMGKLKGSPNETMLVAMSGLLLWEWYINQISFLQTRHRNPTFWCISPSWFVVILFGFTISDRVSNLFIVWLWEIQRLHPDKDLAVDLIQGLPWSQLAKRIDYFPYDLGIQLRNFWETRIKYRDSEGVIRFKKKEDRIPQEVAAKSYTWLHASKLIRIFRFPRSAYPNYSITMREW